MITRQVCRLFARAPIYELDVRGEYDAPVFMLPRRVLVEQAHPVDVGGT